MRIESFGEQISKLVFGFDWKPLQDTFVVFFSYNVEVNFQVFGSFVKDMIGGNVNFTLIVAVYNMCFSTCDMQIIHDIQNPFDLTSGYCKSSIFYFWWRSRKRQLFLCPPWNEESAKEETLFENGSMCVSATFLVSIWVTIQL